MFFLAVFDAQQLSCGRTIVSRTFLTFLYFGPNWPIAVIAVAPTDRTSFVYSYVQTRLKGQYNGKWPFSLVYVLKPLITPIRAICESYSPCVVLNFGNFQNALIFRISGVFLERFVAHNNSNVVVQCFFAPFWTFQFLSQTDQFAKAIAFASWHFWLFSKSSHFSNIRYFLERLFVHNKSNVVVQSFFAPFCHF